MLLLPWNDGSSRSVEEYSFWFWSVHFSYCPYVNQKDSDLRSFIKKTKQKANEIIP